MEMEINKAEVSTQGHKFDISSLEIFISPFHIYYIYTYTESFEALVMYDVPFSMQCNIRHFLEGSVVAHCLVYVLDCLDLNIITCTNSSSDIWLKWLSHLTATVR